MNNDHQDTSGSQLPQREDTHSASTAPVSGEQKPRHSYRWPKEARDLTRTNLHASGPALTRLIDQLVRLTAYPRWACLRFARRMGIHSKKQLRAWTTQEQQRLLKLIDLQPVKEIAKLLRRSESSIWHMLYRMGASAQMGKDSFTKYTLATALHVRPEKIEEWISLGWLEVREIPTGAGKRTIIDGEAFCEFCRKHTKDVVGNRLNKERIEFVYHYAFPVNHSELLPVRASKKERNAYLAQVEQQDQENSSLGQRRKQPQGHPDDDDQDLGLTG
ncbi:MAG TPA: hypothetical protein VKH81_04370 [Candidatus Angelobacter sp.]|nr:hypothetical protein [Candidatus Angelobacter sp.]